jgi:hypothetical protein
MAVAGDAKDRCAGSASGLKGVVAGVGDPGAGINDAGYSQNAPCNEIVPYGAPPSWW